ncbi:uncharacterized protein [Branchiostoma lanceolatum]|uniref:uncharacterized protein n=1 Tax=Branchiostoma lanceolatum TaxID=7740 RepID=UPI00345326FC
MAVSKPSSSDPVYTPGTARGAKLAALLVDEGTSLVRKILEHEVKNMNPPSLREQLKKHTRHLCGLRYLNPGQRKTLYPPDGGVPDTAQGFDISLLELLLKELVRLELGRGAPYSGERDRLRRFRNDNYGHIPSTDLSEEDFDMCWRELTKILVALGGDRDKISERLSWSIDPEQEVKCFTLLERLYKEDMEVKDLVSAQGVTLRQGQGRLESLLEEVRDNQRADMTSKVQVCADSSHIAEQMHQGPPDVPGDVIAYLKDLYATEFAHVRPLPWCEDLKLHLGEVYTSMRLQWRDDRGRFQDTDTIVSFADIYTSTSGKGSQVEATCRKIRVEGDPGMGKSCSCQKLAYDWSCGKLNVFKVVFLLEMRHLAGKVRDEIFEQLLPKDTKTTPDQLWSYIQQNQDDVLFILDGLDELSQTAREVTDVVDLIQGKILKNCHVLVTSRPYHCVKDLEKCHQFYKIVGYSRENSENFIRKYFCKSPESASKLVEKLHGNGSLLEIVVNPLNNVLVCVVWEDSSKELLSSKAELYQDIVYSVAKRFCTKRALPMEDDKLPPDIEEALRGLEKLAWEGLEQEQLQFNIDEITKKYGAKADNMLNLGLLTRDYSFSRIKRICYCAFLHKTFQEYMAARYISGLVMDESSREEGMECVCRLFGMSDATVVNRELILYCNRKYSEVQNWLILIQSENSHPLFERFAEELNKAQTEENRKLLSFLCIMWLGTSCAGDTMAEIVAPCLSDHVTNNPVDFGEPYSLLDYGEMSGVKVSADPSFRQMLESEDQLRFHQDDHVNWCVGLAHVLTFQRKPSVSQGGSFIQHLKINCDCIDGAQQEKLGVLENALSDYGAMRSVTLLETDTGYETEFSTLTRTFIPLCGTESVTIFIKHSFMHHLSLLSRLEQLSAVSMIEHVEIFADCVVCDPNKHDVNFSEYDRQLGRLTSESHSRLRSLKLNIGSWRHKDPSTRGFGNLTATLQSISKHTRLEYVELVLPGNDDSLFTEDWTFVFELEIHERNMSIKDVKHKMFNVEPMVHKLTECIKKNKVLKTLMLRWVISESLDKTSKIYRGNCSKQSLYSLCSAIRGNRTLETLVVEGLLFQSKSKEKMISELIRNRPSNYKELSITVGRLLISVAKPLTL